jgi:hypothetical protein
MNIQTFCKKATRKVLRTIHPDLELMAQSQYHFNRLKRQPPELMWKILPPFSKPRHDAGRGVIGTEIYVFGGFMIGGSVIRTVDVFDMKLNRWTKSVHLPQDMAESHLGIISDEKRFIYIISGQWGGQCRPPTRKCFVFDAIKQTFHPFPDLPKARYAPAVQLWNGRLHVMGGSKEDRNEPAKEHWSIAVNEGQPMEGGWCEELPIPRGGPHRASAVIDNKLYVFGGQEGDYVAIPGDPEYTCTRDLTEDTIFSDVYMIDKDKIRWQRMADMPVGASHTESAIIVLGRHAIILGGDKQTGQKDKPEFQDIIQLYDAANNTWSIVGRLPYHVKSIIAGYHDGYIYFTTGQRDAEDGTPRPGKYDQRAWRARFAFSLISYKPF